MVRCSCFGLGAFGNALSTNGGKKAGRAEVVELIQVGSSKDKQPTDALLACLSDSSTIKISHAVPGGLAGIKERMAAMGHSSVAVSSPPPSPSTDVTGDSESDLLEVQRPHCFAQLDTQNVSLVCLKGILGVDVHANALCVRFVRTAVVVACTSTPAYFFRPVFVGVALIASSPLPFFQILISILTLAFAF